MDRDFDRGDAGSGVAASDSQRAEPDCSAEVVRFVRASFVRSQKPHPVAEIATRVGHPRPQKSCIWKTGRSAASIRAMFKLFVVMLTLMVSASVAQLPSKKQLNLATIKALVAAGEAEAKRLNVEVTICIVDDSGNLLFLEKADGASLNTIQFAQKKARHSALYRKPSKDGADALKAGNL